jgi:chaperone required for assembly of F1-ATPase
MNRISKETKAIADKYITARQNNVFHPLTATTREEVIQGIMRGEVYEEVLNQIEVRYCSITSTLIGRQFAHTTQAYRGSIYKGFKVLLGEVN